MPDVSDIARVAAALHAGGAVVIVGAGLSRPAGMPLVAELPPLLWHALDTDSAARIAVAAELGAQDAPAKTLIGASPRALKAAYDSLRSHPHARQTFQNAFSARDAAADLQFPAHDALARLFHHGVAELIVSYNWDTLFERCYARRYGRRPVVDEVFWKPHGDAARPDLEWVHPGDPGRVPPMLIDTVAALARNRPRVLVIVGYSEGDEHVVRLLTEPLSRRWLVCRIGPTASGELALRHSAADVLPVLAATLSREPDIVGWEYVVFPEGRDLGPALAGRGLGPSDAIACPRLPETISVAHQLRTSHTARVVGPPGSGKSLSAYQAARDLALEGFEVIRLVDISIERPELALVGLRFKTVAIVDDAQLLPGPTIRRLAEAANPRLKALSVSTEHDSLAAPRGAVRIDAKRAVRVIAEQLLADRARTLEAIQRADDRVGEARFQDSLEDRIRSATESSKTPWQFCFAVSGGWRRAGQAADAARVAGADLVLAAAAARQVAFRDAAGGPDEVFRICAAAGVDRSTFNVALHWLVGERLILSLADVRCPHQRFAAVVLDKAYAGMDIVAREQFAKVCRFLLQDVSVTLGGARILLHELRFADSLRWRLSPLLGSSVVDALLARCWSANNPDDIMFACLVLTELDDFMLGWPRTALNDHVELVGRWISSPAHPSGYGLGRLINDAWNKDNDFARALCNAADAEALAVAISSASSPSAWSVGELVDRLRLGASDEWAQRLVSALDRPRLLQAAAAWSLEEVDTLARLASALVTFDEDLGLGMLEAAQSQFRRLFVTDAVETFEDFQPLFMHCLRVFDPLGVYKGRLRADRRRRELARSFLRDIEPSRLAQQISNKPLRQLESAARFLTILGTLRPNTYAAVFRALDLERLNTTFGALWRDLPHDLIVLVLILGSRTPAEAAPVAAWVRRNAGVIETLDPHLGVLVSDVAIGVLDRGGTVALDRCMTFDWALAANVTETVLASRPDLAERLLGPHVQAAATALTRNQSNTYDAVDVFVGVLSRRAPTILAAILEHLSPQAAETAWAACLKGKSPARRAAAAIISLAISHGGALGEIAHRLRPEHPKAPSSRSKRHR